jgi:hypothetical protein
VVSAYLTMAFLTTLLPLGLGPDLLLGDLMSPSFRLFAGALTAIPFGWLVVRWRASEGWDDRHRIWLIGGVLVSHTAFMMPGSATAIVVGVPTLAAQLAFLGVLARRARRDGIAEAG